MPTIRVALLGTGFIARFRLQAYRTLPDVQVVAVLGRDPDRTRAFAQEHGIPHAVVGYEQLLQGPDFDAVDVCLPNHLHLQAVRFAAEAGKAVSCEKPLGRTAAEAQQMVDLVEGAGVVHVYGENWFFSPDLMEIASLVRQGVIGRPLWLRGREGHFGPHSAWFYDLDLAGGGAMLDMGCHVVGTFLRLVGEPVEEVFCHTQTSHHATACEDNAVGLLRFEGGATGQVEASWTVRGGMAVVVEVWGDEGAITFDRSSLSQPVRVFARRPTERYFVEKGESDRGWLFPMVEEHHRYGYDALVRHFVARVGGREEPISTFRDGLAVNRIVDALYASARTRVWHGV